MITAFILGVGVGFILGVSINVDETEKEAFLWKKLLQSTK